MQLRVQLESAFGVSQSQFERPEWGALLKDRDRHPVRLFRPSAPDVRFWLDVVMNRLATSEQRLQV